MTEASPLIDRIALARHRTRAAGAPALFLHESARDEVHDRLGVVNKTFINPAVVTPFPQLWTGLLPGLTIVPDDDVLALDPGAHDLVIHAMALHWANDPVGQLVQCRRALKPDGLCLATCLGGQTLAELRAALGQAEIEVTGGLSPRILPMGEIRDLGGLIQRAGLALPVADSFTLTASYESALHLMRDLRAMGETNALTDRLKRPTRRGVMLRAAQIYGESYGDGARIPASYEIVTLTGWAPDDGQQKPLRPGSAAQRLADALDTRETRLND
ncbi:methyltransferase domain-containing protein [Salipiger aestuarii]|uniref:Methyltransferase family protein n=1 Tax=Salipiger aestuarii TaxID=568098 RepID=A0A327YP76_9RHOB|nr:methyltransferase domain-containing protein [Salipiger aestuarii]EIE50098.1 hypothetical protein C357_15196 [Citreicella sp. 357]KAA8616200.1 SAM-dependent methyltransferase [Salipiger aestuarii]KAB2543146.1 SAM-dependent methyltransferase [Salipiger aestuarii]RAK21465.1 methyltransferase family protein [Salipiger aestuarii]